MSIRQTPPGRVTNPRVFALLQDLIRVGSSPVVWILAAFQLWMLIDAIRRREWLWAVMILCFSVITAMFYFFMVYREAGPAGATSGFELPGARTRKRIKELKTRIHHLDQARDHLDLADIHFAGGKLTLAEAGYRAALERDPQDPDTQAHLGQCLLRRGRPAEAEPLLTAVATADPRHDYGHTLMALAEAKTALGQPDAALALWDRVLANNEYARARVQRAELMMEKGEREKARAELLETLKDDEHSPKFQRSRDAVWMRRARRALSRL